MKNFTYFRPTTPEQAVGLLDASFGSTELLAGGTDLLELQKNYISQPSKVVSLTGIAGLEGIKADKGGLRIGAATKLAAIAEHDDIRKSATAVAEAASIVGGPQIRNMGTLGGNLCQRNRCWYFRDEQVDCLIKGGKICYAIKGENRYHAIFTDKHDCVIVNPSTLAPALIALDAEVEILGPKNEKRTLSIAKFFQAPAKVGEREHVLKANEIVLSVFIPTEKLAGMKSSSYEVRHKQSYDWPLVQAAVAFQLDGKSAKNVRVVLGHVAPTPHVAAAAAKALDGKEVNEANAAEAGKKATEGAKPLSQNEYKIKLVEVAVKRAALSAAGATKYWEV